MREGGGPGREQEAGGGLQGVGGGELQQADEEFQEAGGEVQEKKPPKSRLSLPYMEELALTVRNS